MAIRHASRGCPNGAINKLLFSSSPAARPEYEHESLLRWWGRLPSSLVGIALSRGCEARGALSAGQLTSPSKNQLPRRRRPHPSNYQLSLQPTNIHPIPSKCLTPTSSSMSPSAALLPAALSWSSSPTRFPRCAIHPTIRNFY
jgi:hypothetical protein